MKQHNPSVCHAAPCDITVFVVINRPTLLLHRTLASVYASIKYAQSHGITCDINLRLQDADADAFNLVSRFQQSHDDVSLRITPLDRVSTHDPSQQNDSLPAENYLALVTGENLLGEDWLTLAHQQATKAPTTKILYHAEFSLHFQGEKKVTRHQSSHLSGKPTFAPQEFAATIPWSSLLFFSRHIFPHFSFNQPVHSLAQELAQGAELQIIPGACNFLRESSDVESVASLLPPTKLLCPTQIAPASTTASRKPAKRNKLHKLSQKLGALVQKHAPELPALLSRWKRGWNSLWRKRQKGLSAQASPEQTKLWHSISRLHAIEPQIFPTTQSLTPVNAVSPSQKTFANKYQAACAPITRLSTHVLVIPWLKKGGADLEVLHYVRGIQESSPHHRVLVITTNDADSPWNSRLSSDVMQLPLGELLSDLPLEEQKRLLATLLIQLQSKTIHLVNSRLGYAALKTYGAAIRENSQIFASCFCEDITSDGRISGFAFEEQPEVFPFLSGIFADNQAILDKLQTTYGYPAEKLFLHYMPIDLAAPITILPRETLQVLWAGRLDRQKRPDILRQIAERLQGQPIHFTIYGSAVLKRQAAYQNWSGLSNVSYRGPYDGFETLPLDQFDLLLHTAQWEGLPNVLLEAYASGLPIVASGVGGVAEIIRTGENGVCVTPYDDVDAYCQALLKLQQNRTLLAEYAAVGRALLAKRHSWPMYLQTLSEVPGYLLPSESVTLTSSKVA